MNSKRTFSFTIYLIAILLFTTIIYLKTATFGFVNWDDDENIKTNVQYKELTLKNLKYHYQKARYKSLAVWTFMLDAKLFGARAGGYHLHNVLLHLLNVLLVFILVKKLTQKEVAAVIATTLFALHPVFVEPVAWVTGRKDLLFVLFMLLSVLSYIKYLEKKQNLLWFLLTASLAYLSSMAKIQAVVIPVLLLLLDWNYKRKVCLRLILEKLVLIALLLDKWSLGIFFMVLYGMEYLISVTESVAVKSRWWTKLPKPMFWYLAVVLFFAVQMINDFFNLDPKYEFIPVVLLMLISITGLVYAIKKRKAIIVWLEGLSYRKKVLLIIVPLSVLIAEVFFMQEMKHWFSGGLSMRLSLWTITPGSEQYYSISERFVLGAYAMMYYVGRMLLLKSQDPMIPYPERDAGGHLPGSVLVTVVVYLLLLLFMVIMIRYYRKQRLVILSVLWFLVNTGLVMHFIPIEGRVLAADRYAYPSYIGVFIVAGLTGGHYYARAKQKLIWILLAVVGLIFSIITYINLDTWKNSVALWKKALKQNPNNHYAMYSLSLAYFVEEKKTDKALYYIDEAIKRKRDFQYYNNRGRMRYAVNDINGAYDDFNKSIELDSNSFSAYNNRGAINQKLGNFKSAQKDYNKALSIKPNYAEAINNRRKNERLLFLDSVIQNNLYIPPENKKEVIDFIVNFSQIYIERKNYQKAYLYLSKGIELDSFNFTLRERLNTIRMYMKE